MNEERKFFLLGDVGQTLVFIHFTLKKEEQVVKGVVTQIEDLAHKTYLDAIHTSEDKKEIKYIVRNEYTMTEENWNEGKDPFSSKVELNKFEFDLTKVDKNIIQKNIVENNLETILQKFKYTIGNPVSPPDFNDDIRESLERPFYLQLSGNKKISFFPDYG
jgi:hypothetical protein